MKKKRLPITNIGTAILLRVFIVLCMITFSALSLSSAFRDAEMGQKAANRITEYYTASGKAEELLATADDAFSYAYEQTSDPAEYYRLVHKELLLTALKPIWTGETLDVSFQVEINDSQALLVTIDVLSPQQVRETGAKAFYNILSWQIIRTDTWEGDDTLKLLQ